MKAGDHVKVLAKEERWTGMIGVLANQAGFMVPGPAWWVRFPDGEAQVFDEKELKVMV